MGIRSLFGKKEEINEGKIVLADIDMVDWWLRDNIEPYQLHIDTTIPTERGRKKEYPYDIEKQRLEKYEKRINKMLEDAEQTDYTMYHLDYLYKSIRAYGLVIMKLAEYAPSRMLTRHLMLDVERRYFYTVFLEIEELCEQIVESLQMNQSILDAIANGIIRCESPDLFPLDECQDCEYCEQITRMLLEQDKYFKYLENIVWVIYANAPYLIEWEEDDLMYWKIDAEKLIENFKQYLCSEESLNEVLSDEKFFEIALG